MEHSERSIEEGHRTEFIGGEGEQLRGVKRPGTGNRSKPRPIERSVLFFRLADDQFKAEFRKLRVLLQTEGETMKNFLSVSAAESQDQM